MNIRVQFLMSIFALSFMSAAKAALPVIIDANTSTPLMEEIMANTPDFMNDQIYLNDAPDGVGAKSAWALKGGRGENVRVVDIEIGFVDGHEDLGKLFFIGENHPEMDDNHGTAVLGVIRGSSNAYGVTGIAHGAELGFYGFAEGALDTVDQTYIDGINRAIRESVAQMQPGDVLVIEQHMNGPDNFAYTAVEYWKPIFDELKRATDKGIHCVEAAGNGGSNFDDPSYAGAFDLKLRDSGCIMVGAGAPGSHERLSFSNYGSRIDAHGYGGSVATTGYGSLFNAGPARKYTRTFNGTSSATPIVAGAVALVSSIAEAQGKVVTPAQLRQALRQTGTPQGSTSASQRIGNMPDVPAVLKFLNLEQPLVLRLR